MGRGPSFLTSLARGRRSAEGEDLAPAQDGVSLRLGSLRTALDELPPIFIQIFTGVEFRHLRHAASGRVNRIKLSRRNLYRISSTSAVKSSLPISYIVDNWNEERYEYELSSSACIDYCISTSPRFKECEGRRYTNVALGIG